VKQAFKQGVARDNPCPRAHLRPILKRASTAGDRGDISRPPSLRFRTYRVE